MSDKILKIQNEEYRKLLLEKDDEINNYKFAIKVKDNQTHELIDKLQQKENIIKEVREYMENYIEVEDAPINERIKIEFKELLKMLDKALD